MVIDSLYNKFVNLIGIRNDEDDTFRVIPVWEGSRHRFGCSEEGFPIFFVECSDNKTTTDVHLELIDVQFNRICKLNDSEELKTEFHRYCLVELKSLKKDFTKYFLDVFSLVLEKLPEYPTTAQLRDEVSKLIQLFMGGTSYSAAILQGLWAELLVIDQSNDPDYLISAWHVSANDKYDFNDGIDKIEVKSTGRVSRCHEFALEQLTPNDGSQLLIASVFVIKTGVGKNLFDIEESIISRLQSNESVEKLKTMLIKTLGENLDTVKTIYFDYSQAIDSLCYFNYKDVPSISTENVPIGVSNVHFQSDLTNIESVRTEMVEGRLHKSIGL